MEFALIVRTGESAGKKIPVPPGESRRIGRQPPSDVRVADDPMLSNQHFSVEFNGEICLLRDLGSKFGTQLNGNKIGDSAALRNGDEIRAGRTLFGVEVSGDIRATPLMPSDLTLEETDSKPVVPSAETAVEVPRERPPLTERQTAVLTFLKHQTALHAVLDAARDPHVLPGLKKSGIDHASLYEERDGEELATYGPWLAKLSPDSQYLEDLVRDGWGKSWGVYLTCSLPFAELRRHLRQFLLAKLPDGRQVCFRYYDPRVLRTYMPTCTPEELARFVGPIDRFFAESSDEDELLEFGAHYRDWRKVRLET